MTVAALKVCACGREIVRRVASGRWPIRCTICRNVPPPPYEDHDRAKASAIGPDGWPAPVPSKLHNPASGHRCRTKTRSSPIENMTQAPPLKCPPRRGLKGI